MSDTEFEKRPRPIRAEDGSEDESDSDRDDLGQQGEKGVKASDTAAPTAEKPAKKSPSRRRPAFSENNLVSEKGLSKIYREFPKKCRYKGKGREAEFLRGLMFAYKEWAHQLFPALAFEDLASRTEKLGGKARVRDLMRELRDEERDRFIESKHGREAVEGVRAHHAAKTVEQEGEGFAERKENEGKPSPNGRYVDVGDEDPRPHKRRYEHDGAHENAGATLASAPVVVSSEIRERMEANRRLALERLRMKKQEAEAAARAAGVKTSPAKAGAPAPPEQSDCTPSDDEIMGLLKLDRARGTEKSHDLEDDEAALAEMETQEVQPKAKLAKVNPSGIANESVDIPVPDSSSSDRVASMDGATDSSTPRVMGSTVPDGSVRGSSEGGATDPTRSVSNRDADEIDPLDESDHFEVTRKVGIGGNGHIDGSHSGDDPGNSLRASSLRSREGSFDI